MLERLDYVKLSPRRILDAGAGPAPQAAQLERRYPRAQQVSLDLSLKMLREPPARGLIQRLTGRGKRTAVCAELARIPLGSRSISLVWSNMALHWASDVQSALAEFHRLLEVDGLLMFSTLGPDTLKELRSAFAVIAGSSRVHAFVDMHDLGDMLVAAGFSAPVMDTETITLTYPRVEALTADLRATGQTCALAQRPRGLMTPGRWQRVRAALAHGASEGRLPATMEVVYGHAWKPAPKVTSEGHPIVKLARRPRLRN
jgi:malonyl-CoA O-methyltransferase